MTKEEKKDKSTAMQELKIPVVKRGAFMHWANKYGRFNMHGDWLWYEYSPLEAHHRNTMTMSEMWKKYIER